jgi:hypothetical protein
MNAARQRRVALKKRLEQRKKQTSCLTCSPSTVAPAQPSLPAKPRPALGSLEEQLRESIKLVGDRKKPFTKLKTLVFLKDRGDEEVSISAEHPTEDIMSMQKNGFWAYSQLHLLPIFIPPYSIAKVLVLSATR